MSQNGESTPPSQVDEPPSAPQGEQGGEQGVAPAEAAAPPGDAQASGVADENPDDNIGNTFAPGEVRHAGEPAEPVEPAEPGNEVTRRENAPPREPRDRPRRDRGRRGGDGPQAAPGGPGGQAAPGGQGGQGARPAGPPRREGRGGEGHGMQHRAFHAGDKVRAKIVTLGSGGALVDLWGKERGVLDLRELAGPDAPVPTVGDSVDVIVMQDGTRGGNLVVTRDPNRAERNREMVAQAWNAGEPVEGLITGSNRGGLEVDISGTRAFCPSSQIDIRVPGQQDLQGFVLRRELFKITSLVDGGREAVVSRRALREADVRERAEQAVTRFAVGDRVRGRVVAVKDHGIFVDLGGVEGRIQLSEISHDRGARPSDIAKVGDEIEAQVLRIDVPAALPAHSAPPELAGDAVSSPDAAAEGSPETTPETAPDSAHGAEGGRFDRKHDKKPRFSRLPEGTPRVELSRRAIEADPWADVHKRYPVGSVHKGRVARMQPFGAFIELEKGLDGLLHVSEIGEKRIQHPNEVLKDDQEVNVQVTKIDRGQRRIGLSLLPEGVTAEQVKQSIHPRVGLIAMAKIVEHDTFGMWAQLDGAVGRTGRGLILPQDSNQPKGADLRRALPLGTEVKVKVVEMDRGRLKLSIRAAHQDEERQAYRAYQQQANSTSVGVSLADKLRKLNLGKSSE